MVNSKQSQNRLKETPKMMTRAKKHLQQEQTLTPSNFSTRLSNGEETVLIRMIRHIVKEELEAHEVVLQ